MTIGVVDRVIVIASYDYRCSRVIFISKQYDYRYVVVDICMTIGVVEYIVI